MKMETLTSILAFFISMGCLMMFFAWVGFRVFPAAKHFFSVLGRSLAFVVHPIFAAITFCAKFLFSLSKILFMSFVELAKRKPVAKPVIAKRQKVAIRNDRLCQFDINW
jgi:hypothetical protein